MEILENSEEFIEEVSSITTTENDENSVSNSNPETEIETKSEIETKPEAETSMIEYKEMEEPCVALSIISENRLTNTEVFIRRGIRYSIKAFFSAIVLTVIHLFM